MKKVFKAASQQDLDNVLIGIDNLGETKGYSRNVVRKIVDARIKRALLIVPLPENGRYLTFEPLRTALRGVGLEIPWRTLTARFHKTPPDYNVGYSAWNQEIYDMTDARLSVGYLKDYVEFGGVRAYELLMERKRLAAALELQKHWPAGEKTTLIELPYWLNAIDPDLTVSYGKDFDRLFFGTNPELHKALDYFLLDGHRQMTRHEVLRERKAHAVKTAFKELTEFSADSDISTDYALARALNQTKSGKQAHTDTIFNKIRPESPYYDPSIAAMAAAARVQSTAR